MQTKRVLDATEGSLLDLSRKYKEASHTLAALQDTSACSKAELSDAQANVLVLTNVRCVG